MTLEEVAHQVGCGVATLWRWEHNRRVPIPIFRARLEKILGVKLPDKED